MGNQVKDKIREYIESIGGIESVRKDLRLPLIKKCIHLLNHIEKNTLWDKLAYVYPMIGTIKPIKFNIK